MKNPVIYVILNGSLNMSPGKAASQAVHAAMMLDNRHHEKFAEEYERTVIVLESKDRNQMDGIADYLFAAKIDYEYYIDEGSNEVDPFSLTALAVEPIESDDAEKREIFEGLSLFNGSTDHYEQAEYHLLRISQDLQRYDHMDYNDYTPRFMKKTIKWLRDYKEKNKKGK